MQFSDLALARRLERAEGHACLQYAKAQRKTSSSSDTAWMECAGAYVVFNGIDSPISQTFGLGLFGDLTASSLDIIERFFFDRHTPVDHELSPFAGVAALQLLCQRGYRPIEISSVLFQTIEAAPPLNDSRITVRVTGLEEGGIWSSVNARGWAHDNPELIKTILEFSALSAARENTPCFLAEFEGQPGAAGALSIHKGVAVFAGAATIPELRGQGLQLALLRERLRYAFESGCDLAMMVTEAGSKSQRNAERTGFRIAYTRTKWRLPPV